MKTYRVQEYIGYGSYCKKRIYETTAAAYHNTNQYNPEQKLVILPPEDPRGRTLPAVAVSNDAIYDLIRRYECMELDRCRGGEQSNPDGWEE